jgi:phosphohistidine phosphatase SixA
MPHYLLLMRHAKHEATPKQPLQRRLTAAGEKETQEVGERLVQVICEFQDHADLQLNVVEIWHAETPEVLATVAAIGGYLGGAALVPHAELNPTRFDPYRNTNTHIQVHEEFKTWTARRPEGEAVLLVGHQPFLCWLGSNTTGQITPLVHSELACVAFSSNSQGTLEGTLRWILTPSNDAAAEAVKDLKEKIKSKMEMAKLLGAALAAVLAFLLGYLVDGEKTAQLQYFPGAPTALLLSTIFFLLSTALFFATMYSYDRLLMPKRFWGEKQPPRNPSDRPSWLVWRPPSSELWVLYQNMMRIWCYLFNGATLAGGVGMLCLMFAVFHPTRCGTIILFVLVSAAGAFLIRQAYVEWGPKLGAED